MQGLLLRIPKRGDIPAQQKSTGIKQCSKSGCPTIMLFGHRRIFIKGASRKNIPEILGLETLPETTVTDISSMRSLI